MSSIKAEKILDKVPDLPPPPQVAWKLLEFLKQPTQNNYDVVQIIEFDPVLTAKLLKACNSAFWARGEPVGTVKAALLKLGYQEVQRVAMALSVGGTLSAENKGYGVDAMELWNHSVVTAILSEKIGEAIPKNVPSSDLLFTAGLLHDIGKTVLSLSVLGEIDAIREQVETNKLSILEAEQKILGVDHAEIGACLLKRWNFPADVIEAVANHHVPPMEGAIKLSAVIHVANCCAHLAGSSFGYNSMATRLNDGVLDLLGLKTEDVEKSIIQVHSQLERISSFLSLI
jgi:putative nucleotidyltransferase with HDIG domain